MRGVGDEERKKEEVKRCRGVLKCWIGGGEELRGGG